MRFAVVYVGGSCRELLPRRPDREDLIAHNGEEGEACLLINIVVRASNKLIRC